MSTYFEAEISVDILNVARRTVFNETSGKYLLMS